MSESLWLGTAEIPRYEGLGRRAIRVDVAVIGAGIAGLTAAYLLKRAGMRVAVIEMGTVGQGETGHTTAHLTQILDWRYYELSSKFGRRGARQAALSSAASIDQIEEIVEDLKIDCGFARVPGFLYTEQKEDLSDLEKEAREMEKLGLAPELLDSAPLPFPTAGALRLDRQAQMHPLLYLKALAERVHGSGSFVFENTQAVAIDDRKPCRIKTLEGVVQASRVFCAADAPLSSPYILQTLVYPYRTYALAARCAPSDLVDGLFYDTAEPYHYIRSHEGRVIVGGEDHRVGMKENTAQSFEALESYTRARFTVETVQYRWSGQVLNPADGLPYIGQSPLSRNVYVATGFSGTGMTFGTLSGMICADLIAGARSPWSDLYRPMRLKPFASARDFVAENAEVPKCLVKDWVAGGEVQSVAEIPPGEGRLLRDGVSKAAVYRDDKGRVHAVSAVCPHMGCMVHFNSAEKSWDCPCHGSRFSVDGGLLHGPAMTGLKPLTVVDEGAEDGSSEAA